jgi:hypothetical protein
MDTPYGPEAVSALEHETDPLFQRAMPAAFAKMVALRKAHAGEAGYAPPPSAPSADVACEDICRASGSRFDAWARKVVSDTVSACSKGPRDHGAIIEGMMALKPKDEIEGMLCSLTVAAFGASMESFALANAAIQTCGFVEARDMHLGQAARLAQACAAMVEALDRRRSGKDGAVQKIVVERVDRVVVGQP